MDGRSRLGHWVLAAVLFYSTAGSSVIGNSNGPKNVQVSLRARWPGTPILLEAGELLSKEWKNPFWDFIDTWTEEESQEADLYTVKDCFKKIVRHGQSFLSRPLGSMLELSLSLRLASPRLVIYRQLAEESLSVSPVVNESYSTENVSSTAPGKLESPAEFDLRCSGGKCCWADAGGTIFFEAAKLLEWIHTNSATAQFQQPELFDFDHVYLNSNVSAPPVILYGAVGMICFKDFHVILSEASKRGKIKYVLRPVIPSGCESRCGHCGAIGSGDPLMLSGYGVELALKNMEYKAMDDSDVKKGISLEDPHTEDLSLDVRGFIFSRILERKPDLASQVMAFRDYILSSTISDTLNVWELKDLGHQTAQRILQASDPLQSMQEISHNFPSIVSSLSRTKLNASIKDEIITNQQMFPPGKSLMALNGALISVDDIDLYTLIDAVHQELSLADQLLNLGIPQKTVTKLLLAKSPLEENIYRVDFRSPHVHYINNLEQDAMYKRWRSDIHDILMPVFPGQLRYIRKNMFHAIYVLDPASSSGLEAVELIISLYENGLPVRFGVILFSTKFIEDFAVGVGQSCQLKGHRPAEEDTSSMIIRLFLYVERDFGIQTAFRFLRNVNKRRVGLGTSPNGHILEIHQVEGAFIDTLTSKTKSPPREGLLPELKENQTFREESENSSIFVHEMGLARLQCRLLLNGLVFDSSEEALMGAINDELPRIQERVYYGRIYSDTDVLDKFLTESGVKRHNPLIYGGSAKPRYISLPAPFLLEGSLLKVMDYLHSPGTEDDIKPVTHVFVIDIRKRAGWKLLHEGIRFLLGGAELSRLGVLFNVKLRSAESDTSSLAFIRVFRAAASLFGHKKYVLDFLYDLSNFYGNGYLASCSEPENGAPFLEKVLQLAEAHSLPLDSSQCDLTESALEELEDHLNRVASFSDRHLGTAPSANAVITNGRVFAVEEEDVFSIDDLRLLESVEFRERIKHFSEIVEGLDWASTTDPDLVTSKFISDSVMLVSSSMSSRRRSSENARFDVLNAEHSCVVISNENSSVHIDAVVDPLSSSGQKLSSLLQIVHQYIRPSMRVVLNPVSSLVDLPLKNFYRYVVPTDAGALAGPKAFFANVPPSKTLTMNLDVPEPWLVESVDAVHDLDNILLEKLGDSRTLTAVFELEALLLTGHCSERDHEGPRGLQLILGTKNVPHEVDTLVMANLGYWQMKVSPAVWYLQLSPGSSSELYAMKDGPKKRITVDDLRGKLVRLEVEKKDAGGHGKLPVAGEGRRDGKDGRHWNSDIFKWASGLIGGRSDNGSRPGGRRRGRAVNIFSIASGHLYERFLKIMMLSVLKNTRRPVKFWFIKNYLSPQFKDVIPRMASEYGFEFELVTYKWPTWLHKQKEKQRIIWAYKILFLDVIFPLSLERVIFVDADQVVRADMGELYDMDMRGNPLAYTPFCDNNEEMDGYRFWRQGFWKEHLRGKPYHISALYVVDLVKFRETAAGDNLRVLYETLSKDPNSLSNLDQDLPNYAQHAVPIFSLPQEWLWCESWCGNSTKSRAKTIDLCNNPMTKEPKLQGAQRIVPEWSVLDAEARRFTDRAVARPTSPPPLDESSSEL